MKMKKLVLGMLAVAAFSISAAQASTYTLPGATGEMTSPNSYDWNFSAAGGAAQLNFQLAGYRTLDGDNYWLDIFHLAVNGVEVYTGTFNLGGGGTSHDISNLYGASWVNSNGSTDAITGNGGTVNFMIPIMLSLSGVQTITFSYTSPGNPYAGPQGLGDEAWGVNSASVSSVPLPAALPLMLSGLGALGFVARRRKEQA